MTNDVEKKEFVSSSGSKFYTPIDYQYDEKSKGFVPVFGKKINRYEMIQASKPSCDINYIVKRALAGDMTALNVKTPNYADISDMPDNLNELNELNKNSIGSFDTLDNNIKALFNNNVDTFINAIEDGSYVDIINNYVKTVKEKVVVEKKDGDK